MYKVKEVAEMTGVSVRTLHHYDRIGLLKQDDVSSAGYRLFSDENLERLQPILVFKEMDFPLHKQRENFINKVSNNWRFVLTWDEGYSEV